MKHKLSGCLSATIAITAALCGLSSAAVIGGSGVTGYSYTNSINLASADTFTFKQFDSSLGTLTSVNFVLSLSDWSGTFSFAHPSSLTVGQNSFAGVRTTLSYPGGGSLRTTATQNLTPVDDVVYATGGTDAIVPLGTVSNSQNVTKDSAWAALNGIIGTGNISMSYASVQTSSLADTVGSYVLTPSMSGNLAAYVTYTYDEAPVASVPEPSEFLLGGVPALFGGLLLMRRCRAVRKSATDIA